MPFELNQSDILWLLGQYIGAFGIGWGFGLIYQVIYKFIQSLA